MLYTLENQSVCVTASSMGAELQSIRKNGAEYLWNGDPAYWGRRSPILFPFVGQVRDKKYRYRGKEYPMGQHGFARDMEFRLDEQTEDTLVFKLCDTEESRKVYPFRFELLAAYQLQGDTLTVGWTVYNPGQEGTDDPEQPLYFSIGAHPAFLLPFSGRGDWKDYRIGFAKGGKALEQVESRLVTTGGNVGSRKETVALETSPDLPFGTVIPTDELFVPDALVIEDGQTDEISLIDPDGNAYVTVSFDSPVVGVWSPTHKHAPFICIEPWYGRTDRDDFTGTLEEREYGNVLGQGERFRASYQIKL